MLSRKNRFYSWHLLFQPYWKSVVYKLIRSDIKIYCNKKGHYLNINKKRYYINLF